MNRAEAIPDEFVVTVIVFVLLLKIPDGLVPGAVNVTLTPDSGLLPASLIVTAKGVPNAVVIVADCGVVPAFATIEAGAPAVLDSEKFTVVSPDEFAVTVYGPPAVAFAVNGAEAIPDEFVVNVIVLVLLLKVPDGLVPGPANVTLTPETATPLASLIVTAGAAAKAVLIVADCGVVPATAVILAGTCTTATVSVFDDAAEPKAV